MTTFIIVHGNVERKVYGVEQAINLLRALGFPAEPHHLALIGKAPWSLNGILIHAE